MWSTSGSTFSHKEAQKAQKKIFLFFVPFVPFRGCGLSQRVAVVALAKTVNESL